MMKVTTVCHMYGKGNMARLEPCEAFRDGVGCT